MRRFHIPVLVIMAIIIMVPSCAKDFVTKKQTLNMYKLEDEPSIGAEVLRHQIQLAHNNNIAVDSAKNKVMLDRINRIISRISRVSDIPEFPYEAHLFDVDINNAACAPGGKILVYEGLWSSHGLVDKNSDDQLAAILAHEIAHANARHITERLSTQNVARTIAVAGSRIIYQHGYAGAADIFYVVMGALVPSYSKANEREADRIGLIYMAKAGYNPHAAVELWKKSAVQSKEEGSFSHSHAPSGERAVYLEQLLPEAMAFYKESPYRSSVDGKLLDSHIDEYSAYTDKYRGRYYFINTLRVGREKVCKYTGDCGIKHYYTAMPAHEYIPQKIRSIKKELRNKHTAAERRELKNLLHVLQKIKPLDGEYYFISDESKKDVFSIHVRDDNYITLSSKKGPYKFLCSGKYFETKRRSTIKFRCRLERGLSSSDSRIQYVKEK